MVQVTAIGAKARTRETRTREKPEPKERKLKTTQTVENCKPKIYDRTFLGKKKDKPAKGGQAKKQKKPRHSI